jgi:hypothetical protein
MCEASIKGMCSIPGYTMLASTYAEAAHLYPVCYRFVRSFTHMMQKGGQSRIKKHSQQQRLLPYSVLTTTSISFPETGAVDALDVLHRSTMWEKHPTITAST